MPASLDSVLPVILAFTQTNSPIPEEFHPQLDGHVNSLSSSIAAYDHQISALDSTISQKQALIEALTREVQCLGNIRQGLSGKREELSRQRALVQAPKSAFRRLPAEIIAMIISYALRGRSGGFMGRRERARFARIRSVCAYWRAISFSTPYLWRDLLFEVDQVPLNWWSSDEEATRHFSHRITHWFSRGGKGAPLRLAVAAEKPSRTPLTFKEIMRAILASKLNLECVRIEQGVLLSGFDFSHLTHPTSCSETIRRLSVTMKRDKSDGFPSLDLTNTYPNLRYFILVDTSKPDAPPLLDGHSVRISHLNLQSLELQRVTLDAGGAASILRDLPALIRLHLRKCSVLPPAEPPRSEHYEHPSLRCLVFEGTVPTLVLSALSCPSLQNLYLHGSSTLPQDSDTVHETGKALGNFLDRSRPQDLTFTFSGEFPKALLHSILKSTRSINHLQLIRFDDLVITELPFSIPPSLKWITCWERGTEADLRDWARKVEDCFQIKNGTVEVSAPYCKEGYWFLDEASAFDG